MELEIQNSLLSNKNKHEGPEFEKYLKLENRSMVLKTRYLVCKILFPLIGTIVLLNQIGSIVISKYIKNTSERISEYSELCSLTAVDLDVCYRNWNNNSSLFNYGLANTIISLIYVIAGLLIYFVPMKNKSQLIWSLTVFGIIGVFLLIYLPVTIIAPIVAKYHSMNIDEMDISYFTEEAKSNYITQVNNLAQFYLSEIVLGFFSEIFYFCMFLFLSMYSIFLFEFKRVEERIFLLEQTVATQVPTFNDFNASVLVQTNTLSMKAVNIKIPKLAHLTFIMTVLTVVLILLCIILSVISEMMFPKKMIFFKFLTYFYPLSCGLAFLIKLDHVNIWIYYIFEIYFFANVYVCLCIVLFLGSGSIKWFSMIFLNLVFFLFLTASMFLYVSYARVLRELKNMSENLAQNIGKTSRGINQNHSEIKESTSFISENRKKLKISIKRTKIVCQILLFIACLLISVMLGLNIYNIFNSSRLTIGESAMFSYFLPFRLPSLLIFLYPVIQISAFIINFNSRKLKYFLVFQCIYTVIVFLFTIYIIVQVPLHIGRLIGIDYSYQIGEVVVLCVFVILSLTIAILAFRFAKLSWKLKKMRHPREQVEPVPEIKQLIIYKKAAHFRIHLSILINIILIAIMLLICNVAYYHYFTYEEDGETKLYLWTFCETNELSIYLILVFCVIQFKCFFMTKTNLKCMLSFLIIRGVIAGLLTPIELCIGIFKEKWAPYRLDGTFVFSSELNRVYHGLEYMWLIGIICLNIITYAVLSSSEYKYLKYKIAILNQQNEKQNEDSFIPVKMRQSKSPSHRIQVDPAIQMSKIKPKKNKATEKDSSSKASTVDESSSHEN